MMSIPQNKLNPARSAVSPVRHPRPVRLASGIPSRQSKQDAVAFLGRRPGGQSERRRRDRPRPAPAYLMSLAYQHGLCRELYQCKRKLPRSVIVDFEDDDRVGDMALAPYINPDALGRVTSRRWPALRSRIGSPQCARSVPLEFHQELRYTTHVEPHDEEKTQHPECRAQPWRR
jgi:hypothetical protein